MKCLKILAVILVLNISLISFASENLFTVTKNSVGVSIIGDDAVQERQPYSFAADLSEGAGISFGYADIFGFAPVNKNAGEGSKNTIFLPETEDTTAKPDIKLVADNDSPMANVLGYKRIITDKINAGTITTYWNMNIENFLSDKPASQSVGFWIKESGVTEVYGNSPFRITLMYKGGSLIQADLPIQNMISNAGTTFPITPNVSSAANLATSYDITAECLHRQNGWAYIACNMENIVYAQGYTSSSTLFYFEFSNVSSKLRADGAKLEITNLSYLTGSKINNGYVVYPQSPSNQSFRYVLDKTKNEFLIPADFVTGNINLNITASLRIGNSMLLTSKTIYDKNLFGENREISAEINLNGNNILSVTCDNVPLSKGFEYESSENIYTLQKVLLNNLSEGQHILNFKMDYGEDVIVPFTVMNGTTQTYPVSCAVSGDEIGVRTYFNNENDLLQRFTGLSSTSLDANTPINFGSSSLISKEQTEYFKNGTVLSSGTDEAAPFKFNSSYIGGNHGQSNAVKVTSSSHGKTYADIGSVWLDLAGVRWNLLKVLDANNLLFLSDNIGTSLSKYAFKTSMSGNLTYVSDGINTQGITVESTVGFQQVLPSEKYIKKEVYAIRDGLKYKMVNGDITDCDYVEIIEEYEVINPATIAEALRTNRPAGGYTQAQNVAVGEPILYFNIKYRICNDGTVLSIFDHRFTGDVNFSYYGGIQYLPRNNVYTGGIYRYIPKTLPFSAAGVNYDFTKPYNITTGAVPDFTINQNYWETPNNPPDRVVDYMKDGSGNNVISFSGGYLPILDAEPSARQTLSNAWGFLYPSKKVYPYLITNFPNGSSNHTVRGVAYKKYQNLKDNKSQIGSMYNISSGRDEYLFIDYQTSGADFIKLDITGKSLELIEKSNNITFYKTSDGIIINVADSKQYGYLVLKVDNNDIEIDKQVYVEDSTVIATFNNFDFVEKTRKAIAVKYLNGAIVDIDIQNIIIPANDKVVKTFSLLGETWDDIKLFVRKENDFITPVGEEVTIINRN